MLVVTNEATNMRMQSPRRCVRVVAVVAIGLLLLYAFATNIVPLISPCRRSIPTCGIVESAQRQFGPLPAENSERLRRIDSTCRLAQGGHVDRYTSHPRTRTAYCVVPKTSCTFWLSLFRFLRRPASAMRGDSNPLSIPRAQVHSEQDGQEMQFKSISACGTLPEYLNDHFRFMFVRNPYSRLWSSYIDKLFLLDFWVSEGERVEKFLSSARGVKIPGKRRRFSQCHSDISFAEFLAYVAWSGAPAPHSLNEHWRPVEYLCHPCLFCPHLVGHVETFARDSLPVLHRLNLTWVLHSYAHDRHQMELLVEDNFRQLDGANLLALDQAFYASCTNVTDVSRRLWAAFQMYGYIPESAPFPEAELARDSSVERFKAILFRTHREVPESVRKTLSGQRRRAMEEAYRSVPVAVLEKLSSLYLFEFLAFGYDMRPYELFGKRYEDLD